MIFKSALYAGIFLIASADVYGTIFSNTTYFAPISRREQIMDEVTNDHIAYIKNKYGWRLRAKGGGIPDKIRTFTLEFAIIEKVNIKKARKYIVNAVSDLLYRINTSEDIRQHLFEYPFTTNGVNYRLVFCDNNNDKFYNYEQRGQNLNLSMVSVLNNKIFYTVIEKPGKSYETVHSETFDEACKIVQDEENSEF